MYITWIWIFLHSGIQSGKETDAGRQRLNWALEFLFTFNLLIFRTKQWRIQGRRSGSPLFLDQTEVCRGEKKKLETPPPYLRVWMTPTPLSQGLDPALLNKALDTNKINTNDERFWFCFHKNYKLSPTYPQLAIFYWQPNTFIRTALWELSLHVHQTTRGLKQVLGSNMITLRTKSLTHRRQLPLTEGESHNCSLLLKRELFSTSAGLLFWSEFSDSRQNTGFGDKSIVFLHLLWKFRPGQLDLLSINCDFPNNTFYPMVFPFILGEVKGRGTNENLWEIVASAPFPSPSRWAARSRVLSPLALLTQIGELARRLSRYETRDMAWPVKQAKDYIL